MIDSNNPYHHSAIKAIICTLFFKGPTSLGNKYRKLFKSSHKDRPEPELPIAMVALAATMVCLTYCIGVIYELIITDMGCAIGVEKGVLYFSGL